MGGEPKPCTYCGETDPWPRHFCLVRMTEAMGPNPAPFPCSYSIEGCERFEASMNCRVAAINRLAQAQRATPTEGGDRG